MVGDCTDFSACGLSKIRASAALGCLLPGVLAFCIGRKMKKMLVAWRERAAYVKDFGDSMAYHDQLAVVEARPQS